MVFFKEEFVTTMNYRGKWWNFLQLEMGVDLSRNYYSKIVLETDQIKLYYETVSLGW